MKKKVSIAVIFDRKKQATGTNAGTIEVRVSHDRKSVYFSTGVKVRANQWDAVALKVVRHLDASRLTGMIRDTYTNVCARVERMTAAGAVSLASLRESAGASDPIEWLHQRIMQRPVRESTRRHHLVVYRWLGDCGLFSTWADFTLDNIERFDALTRRQRSDKGETVHNYHKVLRVYLDEAVRHGLLASSPYAQFKERRGPRTSTIRYLTDDERGRLEAADLTGPLDKARDLFVFCCYTGLSYSDMAKLRPQDIETGGDGRRVIVDQRQKTGAPYRITLLPPAIAILDKWGGTLPMMSNVKYNYFLKIVATAAHIDKRLTSHMARHTFATWALGRGVSMVVVSKMLGHSSLATTQLYSKVMQREVDAGYDLLM